jgi:hypothetical protein
MSAIKAGDLVMVVHVCCTRLGAGALTRPGVPVTVRSFKVRHVQCSSCGWTDKQCRTANIVERNSWAPVAWLKKIDPPAERESIEHREELTA